MADTSDERSMKYLRFYRLAVRCDSGRRSGIPTGSRRHSVEWAYVNVDVGGGGAFAYDSRVR